MQCVTHQFRKKWGANAPCGHRTTNPQDPMTPRPPTTVLKNVVRLCNNNNKQIKVELNRSRMSTKPYGAVFIGAPCIKRSYT